MRQPDDFPDEALPEDNLTGEDLTDLDLADLDLAGEEFLEDELGDASPKALTDDEPDEPGLGEVELGEVELGEAELGEAEPDEGQLDEEGSGAGPAGAIAAAGAVLAAAGSNQVTTVVVTNVTEVSATEVSATEVSATEVSATGTSVTETSVTGTSVTGTSVTEMSTATVTILENAWEPAPRPTLPPWTRKAYADKLLAYSSAPSYADYVARSQGLGQLLHSRYAETRLSPAAQQAANAFPETLNILALIAEEDPDTVAVLPIVARLVAAGPRLQLRVLSDEGDLFALSVLAPEFDQPTILEEWDLPQFLLFDEEWELQAQWGPRPSAAEPQVEAWLAAHPEYEALAEDESAAGQERYAALTQRLMYEMRVWYNSSLAKSCLDEWQALLSAWQNGEDAVVEGEA